RYASRVILFTRFRPTAVRKCRLPAANPACSGSSVVASNERRAKNTRKGGTVIFWPDENRNSMRFLLFSLSFFPNVYCLGIYRFTSILWHKKIVPLAGTKVL